jgi:hypothetical protein
MAHTKTFNTAVSSHPDCVLLCTPLSCTGKEKQFCLFNIVAVEISKRNLSVKEKHVLLYKLGLNILLLVPKKTLLNV